LGGGIIIIGPVPGCGRAMGEMFGPFALRNRPSQYAA
jgi:hypothetical protein